MYPLLILREEAVCLIVLVFLLITAHTYQMGKDSGSFFRLAWYAIIHVVFDIVTVLTVNNLDTVSLPVNNVCHAIFYISAILYALELCFYVFKLCYPEATGLIKWFGYGAVGLYILLLPWLPIEYVTVSGTNSSSGPAAMVGYSLGFVYFVFALLLIAINFRRLKPAVKATLLPMLLVLMGLEVSQVIRRELLFTGGGLTIVTVGFFFSLENPVLVFQQKVMTDALTGVRSRHSYEQEMAEIDRKFRAAPSTDYLFVFCDINNLKAVNGLYGHLEGDSYITFIAATLSAELKHAVGIYRMGGDEFLAIYQKTAEIVVQRELKGVLTACAREGEKRPYQPAVAMGYAISGPEYKNLRDCLSTADYIMYKNKAELKKQNSIIHAIPGMRMNLTGLTDRLFDALCLTNDRSYPFLTNMETLVTRIAPAWKEYFGLEEEFYASFTDEWVNYIHPEDREAFLNDIIAVLNGKKAVHNAEYRAKNPNGEYVLCSCHGSIYRGKDGEPDVFVGYMTNHGVVETIDAVTSLRNFAALDEVMEGFIGLRRAGVIIKLRINNLNRINMLYGYEDGLRVLRRLAEVLSAEVGEDGEVFCQDGSNFTILLPGITRLAAVALYNRIADILSTGILMEDTPLPVNISGGAFELTPESSVERRSVRSCLICALDESSYIEHNRLVFYDSLTGVTETGDLKLLAAIHHDAVAERRYFRLAYQSIVNTADGRLVGAEALLRWVHPDYGTVPPGKFIAFLENDPCYYDLGLSILEKAVEDSRELRRRTPGFTVNVNITALQLQRADFPRTVMDTLERAGYPPEGLCLELTERCKEMEQALLERQIALLRAGGIRVAFDDMGTGYSTLNLLMSVAVDEIKLDRAFVTGIRDNAAYRIFVDALARGAEEKHYIICFEGVEDQETLEFLRGFGPSLAQGYHFSKPMFFEDFREKVG